ncbi:exported protein of unknown function [Nitrosotalea devaniterrae]|uniref:Uncharacterized protein n=1 Tax=Nitrosotalea devaniterrae TaxID=1078905 RepID=A0A128A1U1_9ARCH|nr:exported protein of unknown function [Candidatus Nitrosotalea devanaterra]
MELREIILTSIIFLSFGIPIAYATSYATLHLDSVGNILREDSIVTFSGQLTSSNGTTIPHRTVFIEDDTSYFVRPNIIIAITTTDSDGKFSVSWKAVPKDNGNPFHFYAKYLGGNFFGYTKSESYESIVKHTNQSSTDVVPSKTIPIWFEDASKMWHDGEIRDIDYSWSIKNLIEHGIIKSNDIDTELKLPSWLKKTANLFVNGEISKEEYVNNLQYLLKSNII